jgi:hypothetical protein
VIYVYGVNITVSFLVERCGKFFQPWIMWHKVLKRAAYGNLLTLVESVDGKERSIWKKLLKPFE